MLDILDSFFENMIDYDKLFTSITNKIDQMVKSGEYKVYIIGPDGRIRLVSNENKKEPESNHNTKYVTLGDLIDSYKKFNGNCGCGKCCTPKSNVPETDTFTDVKNIDHLI